MARFWRDQGKRDEARKESHSTWRAPAVRAASAWSNADMGLNRCRYKGDAGMKRWVGLGVIADNLINIGRAMAKQSVP